MKNSLAIYCIILFPLVLLLFPYNLEAQPDKTEGVKFNALFGLLNRYPLRVPSYYAIPRASTLNEQGYIAVAEDSMAKGAGASPWYVRIAEDDVQSYKATDNSKEVYLRDLSFGERFVVGEATEHYLRLLKPDAIDTTFRFRGNSRSIRGLEVGWVHKSKLILSSQALLDSLDASIFVLTAIDASRFKTVLNDDPMGLKEVQLFRSPLCRKRDSQYSDPKALRFASFLYVYKVAPNGSALVGNSPELASNKAPFGWIKPDRSKLWKNKFFLSPRKNSLGIDPMILLKQNTAETLLDRDLSQWSAYVNSLGTGEVFHQFKNNGDSLPAALIRPLITEEFNYHRGKTYKTIFSSPVIKEDGSFGPGPEEIARELEKLRRKLEQASNMNIVFVIDGTYTSFRHHQAIMTAIHRFTNTWMSDANISMKIGAVLYGHDKGGEGCSKKEIIDFYSLEALGSKTSDKIESWLFEKRREQCPTNSVTEAVLSGIKEATILLKQTRTAEQNSNLIVVLGDAPQEDLTNIKLLQVAKKCDTLNTHLITFRLNKPEPEPFTVPFDEQMQSLIEIVNKSLIDKPSNIKFRKNNQIPEPSTQPKPIYHIRGANVNQLEDCYREGMLVDPELNGTFTHSELDTILTYFLDKVVAGTKEAIELIKNRIQGLTKDIPEYKYIPDLVDSYLFDGNNATVFVNAYIPFPSIQNNHEPIFEKGLFMKVDDFNFLKNLFGKLAQTSVENFTHSQLSNVFKEVVELSLGPDRVENWEDFGREKQRLLVERAVGGMSTRIPFLDQFLNAYTVSDSFSGETVTAFSEAVNSVRRKASDLKVDDIMFRNQPFADDTNKYDDYYWIPLEVLTPTPNQ